MSAENDRLFKEAMADPEKVTVVVTGRNGYRNEITIHGGDRTALQFEMSADQDRPEVHYRELTPPPAWKRFTFTVEQRFSYRAEDFQGLLGGCRG